MGHEADNLTPILYQGYKSVELFLCCSFSCHCG